MAMKLLELCGFAPDEIKREQERIDRVFEKLALTPEDILQAEKRVKKNFDVSLTGIRKCLGIWMKQLIDLVLAREEGKKIVYPSFPNIPMIGLALNLASEKIYCQAPEIVVALVVGQILGKIDPILEEAEAKGLPPGIGMCSLNQVRLGAIAKGIIPLPDLTLPSGSFCDQAPKVDELLHEIYGVKAVFIDGVMDSTSSDYPQTTPRRVKYFGKEIRRAIDETQKTLDIEISDEKLDRALQEMVKLYYGLVGLWDFMKKDPVPVSQADLGLFFWLLTSPERRCMAEAFDTINTLTKEVKKRADDGRGVVEKGAPRVLLLSHHVTDPGIMHMIEDSGLAISLTSLASISDAMAMSFAGEHYTTFEDRAADQLLSFGLYHSVNGLIQRCKELSKNWQVDGFINLYPFSCRPLALSPLIAKKDIEEDLGIPVLALEGDYYDTRNYSAEALKTRVETFAEMLRASKAAEGRKDANTSF